METDLDKAKSKLKEVKGNLVTMPLHFLESEGDNMPDGGPNSWFGNIIRKIFD